MPRNKARMQCSGSAVGWLRLFWRTAPDLRTGISRSRAGQIMLAPIAAAPRFSSTIPANFLRRLTMAKVAFLGLGVMGYPMAGHLLKKGGHEVTVYNRTAAKAQQWMKEYGGKHAATPREAAKDCEFVMMCVGNDDDVRSVLYGDNGALAGMQIGRAS